MWAEDEGTVITSTLQFTHFSSLPPSDTHLPLYSTSPLPVSLLCSPLYQVNPSIPACVPTRSK